MHVDKDINSGNDSFVNQQKAFQQNFQAIKNSCVNWEQAIKFFENEYFKEMINYLSNAFNLISGCNKTYLINVLNCFIKFVFQEEKVDVITQNLAGYESVVGYEICHTIDNNELAERFIQKIKTKTGILHDFVDQDQAKEEIAKIISTIKIKNIAVPFQPLQSSCSKTTNILNGDNKLKLLELLNTITQCKKLCSIINDEELSTQEEIQPVYFNNKNKLKQTFKDLNKKLKCIFNYTTKKNILNLSINDQKVNDLKKDLTDDEKKELLAAILNASLEQGSFLKGPFKPIDNMVKACIQKAQNYYDNLEQKENYKKIKQIKLLLSQIKKVQIQTYQQKQISIQDPLNQEIKKAKLEKNLIQLNNKIFSLNNLINKAITDYNNIYNDFTTNLNNINAQLDNKNKNQQIKKLINDTEGQLQQLIKDIDEILKQNKEILKKYTYLYDIIIYGLVLIDVNYNANGNNKSKFIQLDNDFEKLTKKIKNLKTPIYDDQNTKDFIEKYENLKQTIDVLKNDAQNIQLDKDKEANLLKLLSIDDNNFALTPNVFYSKEKSINDILKKIQKIAMDINNLSKDIDNITIKLPVPPKPVSITKPPKPKEEDVPETGPVIPPPMENPVIPPPMENPVIPPPMENPEIPPPMENPEIPPPEEPKKEDGLETEPEEDEEPETEPEEDEEPNTDPVIPPTEDNPTYDLGTTKPNGQIFFLKNFNNDNENEPDDDKNKKKNNNDDDKNKKKNNNDDDKNKKKNNNDDDKNKKEEYKDYLTFWQWFLIIISVIPGICIPHLISMIVTDYHESLYGYFRRKNFLDFKKEKPNSYTPFHDKKYEYSKYLEKNAEKKYTPTIIDQQTQVQQNKSNITNKIPQYSLNPQQQISKS